MIENVLTLKQVTYKKKITIKTLISIGIVAMAVTLPMLVHLIAGNTGGMRWLPMYLPILIGGCLLGAKWGSAIAVISPLVSYFITLSTGTPMPSIERLPFMIAELVVFAITCGLFSKKIMKNSLIVIPAVLLAEVLGRSVLMLLVVIFNEFTIFTPELIWEQIKTGLLALGLQAIIMPFIVISLKCLLNKSNQNKNC